MAPLYLSTIPLYRHFRDDNPIGVDLVDPNFGYGAQPLPQDPHHGKRPTAEEIFRSSISNRSSFGHIDLAKTSNRHRSPRGLMDQ